MTIYNEIRNLKAESKFKEAWQVGYSELERDPTNVYLKTSLFWVVYAALKKIIEPIRIRQNKTPTPKEVETIDLYFTRIGMLNLTLPNDNIDFRLWNLIKGVNNFEGVGKYSNQCCKYIVDNYPSLFSDLDYKPYITEKGEAPSTVFRLARTVAANVLMSGSESAISLDSVIDLVDYAINRAEDCLKNKIWLQYDKARLFVTFGELTEAREVYLDVLKAKRSESWIWFGLAETFKDEPEKAISLIAHGLCCVKDPKFAIKGLISITSKLSDQGEYLIASKTLNWLLKIYRDNGWSPKDNVVEMTANSWFDGSAELSDLDKYLKNLSKGAIEYTIIKPVYYTGIIERIHQSGKGCNVYVNKELQMQVRRNLFEVKSLMQVGCFLNIIGDASTDIVEVVKVELADAIESDDIKRFNGKLRLLPSGIGFVDDIFIPSFLATGLSDGADVNGLAINAFDKKKSQYSWKAVSIMDIV
jgi:tetratricopeptide (TPR) repeat protein